MHGLKRRADSFSFYNEWYQNLLLTMNSHPCSPPTPSLDSGITFLPNKPRVSWDSAVHTTLLFFEGEKLSSDFPLAGELLFPFFPLGDRSRYFYGQVIEVFMGRWYKKVSNFKPHYILQLLNRMVKISKTFYKWPMPLLSSSHSALRTNWAKIS